MAETNPTSPPPSREGHGTKEHQIVSVTMGDDELNAGETGGKPKYKHRKLAIFFAYCGVGYQGMQRNPGAKTIEGELEEALYQSGAVSEELRGNPKGYDFARSARTDKGVSAVGQVVSGRFFIDPPGLLERLNSNLPGQIRIFGYKQATDSFNAKKFCDRRRYVYLLPIFTLDPSSHRDREAVMASLGSGEVFVKCLGCSDRGRKVVGVMGKSFQKEKSKKTYSGHLSNSLKSNGNAANFENLLDTHVSIDSVSEDKIVLDFTMENNNEESDLEVVSAQDEGSYKNLNMCSSKDSIVSLAEEMKEDDKNREFCYNEEVKERFNRILNHYVGSHNFHNFTTRTKADDPAAQRHILSFRADTTMNLEGIEFIKCVVFGRSFMLHQIRKMMGLAVAIMRNTAPESLIDTALQKDVKINVPMAPEVGLYLDECFFMSYNSSFKDSEELSMKDYNQDAEEFKIKHIYPHVASTEHNYGNVAIWLHSLNYRNYPDLRFVYGRDNGSRNLNGAQKNRDCIQMEVAGGASMAR